MAQKDIRWLQRFNNFKKALTQLTKFIDKGDLNELEEQGLIQSFEYCYELAWNVIKDFYEYQGDSGIQGARDAFQLAFKRELLKDGEVWMDMVQSRNQTTHTYNEDTAKEIATAIVNNYYPQFINLKNNLDGLAEAQQL